VTQCQTSGYTEIQDSTNHKNQVYTAINTLSATHELSRQLKRIGKCHWQYTRHSVHRHHTRWHLRKTKTWRWYPEKSRPGSKCVL